MMKKALPLLLLLVLTLAAWAWLAGNGVSGIGAVRANSDALLAAARAHPVLAPLAFVSLYVICAALSLPVAAALSLLGGFLFGAVAGTMLIVAGAGTGAVCVFMIARSAFGETLRAKAEQGAAGAIAARLRGNGFSALLFMRIVPLFPFWLVNLVPAFFGMGLRDFAAATFIGIVPASFVYANAGRALGEAAGGGSVFSPGLWAAFALLGFLSLLPILLKRRNS